MISVIFSVSSHSSLYDINIFGELSGYQSRGNSLRIYNLYLKKLLSCLTGYLESSRMDSIR